MSVTFTNYVPKPSDEPCLICLTSLDQTAVAHGETNFHKMCRACATQWIRVRPICPGCVAPVANANSFMSLRQRTVTWIKNSLLQLPGRTIDRVMSLAGPLSMAVLLSDETGTDDGVSNLFMLFAIGTGFFIGNKIANHSHTPSAAGFVYGGLATFACTEFGKLSSSLTSS